MINTHLKIPTPDGVFEASIIQVVAEIGDATAYIVSVPEVGEFAAIEYRDGEIITSADWQGTCGHDDRDTVLAEMSNPAWAHHWMRARDLAACIIIDGLPRVLG